MHDPEPSTRPPLVLIANDQEWSARSLESILAPNGYAVLRAFTGQQAIDRARTAKPDLIILDAQMPDIHGVEVCRTLRSDPDGVATPIIITTAGPSGRAQRLDAYRAGAWEFLGQPLDGEALLLKLDTFLLAKREADRIQEENIVDHASGLYNMRGLSRRAREVGSDALRRRAPMACVVFTPEPAEGGEAEETERIVDQVAEQIGKLVRATGRACDVPGRLGPAEFAIIAPATPPEGALRLVDRLGEAIETTPVPVSGVPRRLRLRAGYCAVSDFAASRVDAVEMLLRATSALRQLRASGEESRSRAFEELPVTPPR